MRIVFLGDDSHEMWSHISRQNKKKNEYLQIYPAGI